MNTTDMALKSFYAPMSDGVRLAISAWLPEKFKSEKPRPAVLMTTRYWRAVMFREDKPELQDSFLMAKYLWQRGYVLVVGDARGTGASFGTREMELAPNEINDIGETIEWVAAQSWCDGRVATSGTSYTADTTFMSFITSPSPLKVGVSRAVDFDAYRQLMAPGGILNTWMIRGWAELTGAQDRNDAKAVFAEETVEFKDNVLGVRLVDEDTDGSMLAAAVTDHDSNFNLKIIEAFEFMDDTIPDHPALGYESFSTYSHKKEIEANATPFVYRTGWYDSGTQLGALNLFTTFSNPKRIIIGPWSHRGDFRADPFQPGDGTKPEEIPLSEVHKLVTDSLDPYFKDKTEPLEMDVLEYYTLGENKWKKTRVWPLPETRMDRFYLSENNTLAGKAPFNPEGSDIYQVDPTTGTGQCNRWHTQMGMEIHHSDRQDEDKKLLVYDTPPLTEDVEITGHPVIHLFIRSNAVDGQFFVYLEAVESDGRVRLITEGQLRGINRKISEVVPPYKMFGPYHTFKRSDALPLVPGEVSEIAFDLFPISVLLKKGQQIRIAIAGADKDVFDPILGCEAPEIIIERNTRFASFIDLPILSKK